MRLVDYHSHSTRCGHATGELEEYVLRARELGLREFGISDHAPWMLQQVGRRLAMKWEELPGYIDEVRGLQEKYNHNGANSFHVRLGLEMDYIPCRLEEARGVIARYDWDFLLGSVHNTGLILLGDAFGSGALGGYAPEVVCDYYYQLMGEMIRARYADVIGHLDMPKRFGVLPQGGMIKWIEPLIPAIRASGMAVEINTSGRDYQPSEPMPGWEIIEALAAAGVPLTLGSDAHKPGQVGRYFGEVIGKLKAMGVKEILRFEKRQAVGLKLESIRQTESR